jgi:hypothetical protein
VEELHITLRILPKPEQPLRIVPPNHSIPFLPTQRLHQRILLPIKPAGILAYGVSTLNIILPAPIYPLTNATASVEKYSLVVTLRDIELGTLPPEDVVLKQL